ncbi:MAG: hypothetical protein QUV07_16165 [Cyanobium sp. CZS 25K]|nr:hypothetical protein [Cyanobium sp. CZS25K]
MIAEAIRIFGFDGWQQETIEVRCVSQVVGAIGRDQRPGWGVTSAAAVIREGEVLATASTPTWARPMNPPSRRPRPMP